MPVTGQDVARRANVSKMTVSRVLSGKDIRGISPLTRQRVLNAVQELDYQPNVLARSFRTQRTDTVGFYTSLGWVTTHDPFFSEVINGLGTGCGAQGKNFRIFGMWPRRPEDENYAELMGGQLDGLIVLMDPGDPLAVTLAASLVPVVAFAESLPGLHSVLAADREGSRLLAEHLAQKGHRRVLYRRGSENTTSLACDMRRYTAFCEAARDLGMTVLEGRGNFTGAPGQQKHELGERELAWLTGPPGQRPTAAACWSDPCAFNLMSHCRRLGIRVPEDLAVAGFDGSPISMELPFTLTTVCASWTRVMQTAVSHVMALRDGIEVPWETVLPVKLVVGDTA